MQLYNARLDITRLDKHLADHYEIKDPSIVQTGDGRYLMYASVGNSVRQEWLVGRFEADHPSGPWRELEPVIFENIAGPQLCAPAVTYQQVNGQDYFAMYIQTACFEENGVIAFAESTDGQHFVGQSQPLVTKEQVNSAGEPVVGVYDVGVSDVKNGNDELICMLYSGYRRVGCGDIYVSYKNKQDPKSQWSRGERLLAQEDLPFHNRPDYEFFEWGLEGAKIIQLDQDCFLLIGVCFMPKPHEYLGRRQRVFMAAASSLNGPYRPIGLPFQPSLDSNQTAGENGHPDTFVDGTTLWVIYQERHGNGQPWHLRVASFDLLKLEAFMLERLVMQSGSADELAQPEPREPESFHFLTA